MFHHGRLLPLGPAFTRAVVFVPPKVAKFAHSRAGSDAMPEPPQAASDLSSLKTRAEGTGFDVNGNSNFGERTSGLASHSFRGPGMHTFDVGISNSLELWRDRRLLFYVDSFNVLNTKNVRNVLNNYGPDNKNPNPRGWSRPGVSLRERFSSASE